MTEPTPEPLDLDALRRQNAERRQRKEATGKAPWESRSDGWSVRDAEGFKVCSTYCHGGSVGEQVGNQEFIAAARNDPVEDAVDALIAELERLRAELDRRGKMPVYLDHASIHAEMLRCHPEIDPSRSHVALAGTTGHCFAYLNDMTETRDGMQVTMKDALADCEVEDYHGLTIGIVRWIEDTNKEKQPCPTP